MSASWKTFGGDYTKFSETEKDKIRKALLDPILIELISPKNKAILDYGCGDGYFTRKLQAEGAKQVVGLDISKTLIDSAKRQDSTSDYRVIGGLQGLEEFDGNFEAIVANMVMMDVPQVGEVFKGLAKALKETGKLVISIVNPYYAFPVGKWKRDLREILKGNWNPVLKIGSYFPSRRIEKEMFEGRRVEHFHRTVSEYVRGAKRANLSLTEYIEPQPDKELQKKFRDSKFIKRLEHTPLFLILGFSKHVWKQK